MRCHMSLPHWSPRRGITNRYCDDCAPYVEGDTERLFALDADEEGWLRLGCLRPEADHYGKPAGAPERPYDFSPPAYDYLALASSYPIPTQIAQIVSVVAADGIKRMHVCSDKPPPLKQRQMGSWSYTGPITTVQKRQRRQRKKESKPRRLSVKRAQRLALLLQYL